MLQHFPSRQTDRDAVIISDLAADCVGAKVTESALKFVCEVIRQGGTDDKPFLPPTGEILRRAREQTGREERPQEDHPKAKPAEPLKKGVVQWYGKMWSEFTDSDKATLKRHLATLTESQFDDYVKYLINMIGMPKEALI